jgi:hypothetical protein
VQNQSIARGKTQTHVRAGHGNVNYQKIHVVTTEEMPVNAPAQLEACVRPKRRNAGSVRGRGMHGNGTDPQPKSHRPVAMPSRPGSLSSLQLKLWRALVHAEGLYKDAQGADLTLQLKALNSFTQLAMAYLKSITVHDYNTHPVVDKDL